MCWQYEALGLGSASPGSTNPGPDPTSTKQRAGRPMRRRLLASGTESDAVGRCRPFLRELGVVKLEADVLIGNADGIALLESGGFRRAGKARRVHPKRGSWVEAQLYGIIPEDLGTAR